MRGAGKQDDLLSLEDVGVVGFFGVVGEGVGLIGLGLGRDDDPEDDAVFDLFSLAENGEVVNLDAGEGRVENAGG